MMTQSVRDFLILLGYMAVATLVILTANALALAAVMTSVWLMPIIQKILSVWLMPIIQKILWEITIMV